jgi:hypothetical protein
MRSTHTCALAAILAAFTGSAAFGGTFFYDDFESPSTPVTTWADTTQDADPIAPVIGPNWVVFENIGQHQIQEVDHPTDLVGPPWAGGAGPTFDTSPTGGNQYLHMWGYPILNGYASAPIPVSEQANIAASGRFRLDVETYALSGVDGWNGGLRITGWDVAAGGNSGTNVGPRAFDVFLMNDGSVLNNPGNDPFGTSGTGPYNAGYQVIPGLSHDINTWEKITIIADFNTDTFWLTLDGVTVGGLTWNGGDLTKIQSVTLTLPHIGTPRGGFDNFSMYEPEPTGLGVLAICAGVVVLRRTRR